MFMDTYQVVSEHSILSARRRDRDAAGTPRRSKRCRLKQIGATGESDRSHDAKATSQSDFKVYDRGRSKIELTDSRRKCRNRRRHAPTRRSGKIDEILEKLHEILEDFSSLKTEVFVESNKQVERRETEESERERDGIGGSSCVPWDVIAKPETEKEDYVVEAKTHFAEVESEQNDEDDGDRSDEELSSESRFWPLEKVKWDEEPSPAEPPLEESPDVELDSGATVEELVVERDLQEGTHSLVTELFDEEKVVEVAGMNDRAEEGRRKASDGDPPQEKPLSKPQETESPEGSTTGEMLPESTLPPICGAAIDESRLARKLPFLAREVEGDKDESRETVSRAEWALKQMEINFTSLGQTQYLITTHPQLTNSQAQTLFITFEIPVTKSALQGNKGERNRVEQHNIRFVPSLSEDPLLSPILDIKRLEELFLARFSLDVKDENSRSYSNGLQLMLKGDGKHIKLLVGVGRSYSNGCEQLTNTPILEMHPPVQQRELGGLKRYEWDPGGKERDESKQGTSAMEYQGNQTQQYYKGDQQVSFTFRQITNVVEIYGAVSMSSKVLKNPIIWAVEFNNEVRLLERANEVENKQLLFSAGEILNWKQGIGAEIKVAMGNQCVHVGIGREFIALVYGILVIGGAVFMAPMKFNVEEDITPPDSACDHKNLGESQAFNYINPWKLNEFEISGEALELLKEEEDLSGGAKSEWHKIVVEPLVQQVESPRKAKTDTHYKQWDPGGNHYSPATCLALSWCFQLWDPGEKPLSLLLSRYLHLEDKVNFKGGGIDTNKVNRGYIGNIQKVNEWKKWEPMIWRPQCKSSIDSNNLPTWQREGSGEYLL